MLHLLRKEDREKKLWNISTDLVINAILLQNNYSVPEELDRMKFYVPDHNDSFTFEFPFGIGKLTIENISKKNAETVYDEIVNFLKNNPQFQKLRKAVEEIIDELEREGGLTTIDKHKHGKERKNGKGGGGRKKGKFDDEEEISPKEMEELKKKWKKVIAEATQLGRMAGKLPAGIERIVEDLLEPKLNWRELLYNCITREIPVDFSWARPHKKSFANDVYLPNIVREKIEITVVIDTSGSITDEELKEFLSEVVGILRTFRNRVSMRIITHDAEVQDDYEFDLATEEEVKGIEIHGGGGTSFENTIKYINENSIRPKLLIWLTDGYGDEIVSPLPCKIIWVICENGSDEICKKYGDIIWLK